jgi:Redoxin
MRWVLPSMMMLVACKSASQDAPATIGTTAPITAIAPAFSFDSLDARPVSSDAFRGKTTVISFITTWDIGSQAQVVYLTKMADNDGESTNYAIVAMQDATGRELVEQYAKVLHVNFPVAMGDPAMLTGGGPLGDVHQVPTTVILDAAGRVVYRSAGVLKSEELRAHMPH